MDVGVAPLPVLPDISSAMMVWKEIIYSLFFLPVNADTGDNGPLIQFSRIPATCYRAQARRRMLINHLYLNIFRLH